MRQIVIVVSAFVFASVLVSLAALSAGAQTAPAQQYASEGPVRGASTTPERSSDAAGPEDAQKPRAPAAEGSPSQGSYTEGRAGPTEPSLVDGTGPSASESDDPVVTARGRASGNDAVRTATRYIGTKYRYATCTRSRMSCTCLVKKVFARFGHKLPMSEGGQWKHRPSRKVPKSKLRPGDIVFFKEGGRKRGITHNGIYSGKGNLVHASAYFGKVVESKMKYIKGYSGAKRLRLR